MTTTKPTTVQQIVALLTTMGITLSSSPLKGRPRFLGAATDKSVALELIGPLEQLRAITVLASVDPAALEAARRNGELLGLFLDLVAPRWPQRTTWLTEGLQRFQKVQPRLERDPQRLKALPWIARLPHVEVRMTYLHKTNRVVLTIKMRGAYVAIATA